MNVKSSHLLLQLTGVNKLAIVCYSKPTVDHLLNEWLAVAFIRAAVSRVAGVTCTSQWQSTTYNDGDVHLLMHFLIH